MPPCESPDRLHTSTADDNNLPSCEDTSTILVQVCFVLLVVLAGLVARNDRIAQRGYVPIYPPWHGNLPDPEIRTFITNFYRVSDRPDGNELWVGHFTKDALVIMGNDRGRGEQGMLISVSGPLFGSRCATGMDGRN